MSKAIIKGLYRFLGQNLVLSVISISMRRLNLRRALIGVAQLNLDIMSRL
jgi:hypothetical protein